MDYTFGIQIEPPTGTKSCTFSCSMPLFRRHLSMRTMEFRGGPCEAPRSVLETTSMSSRCSRKENHLRVASSQPRVSYISASIFCLLPPRVYPSATLAQTTAHMSNVLEQFLASILARWTRFLGGDGGVILDEFGNHATSIYQPLAKESRPIAASPALVKHLQL